MIEQGRPGTRGELRALQGGGARTERLTGCGDGERASEFRVVEADDSVHVEAAVLNRDGQGRRHPDPRDGGGQRLPGVRTGRVDAGDSELLDADGRDADVREDPGEAGRRHGARHVGGSPRLRHDVIAARASATGRGLCDGNEHGEPEGVANAPFGADQAAAAEDAAAAQRRVHGEHRVEVILPNVVLHATLKAKRQERDERTRATIHVGAAEPGIRLDGYPEQPDDGVTDAATIAESEEAVGLDVGRLLPADARGGAAEPGAPDRLAERSGKAPVPGRQRVLRGPRSGERGGRNQRGEGLHDACARHSHSVWSGQVSTEGVKGP